LDLETYPSTLVAATIRLQPNHSTVQDGVAVKCAVGVGGVYHWIYRSRDKQGSHKKL